ncbi:MAG: hypothetical protein PHH83_05050 [Patescibacteria group bacterium]|nr:hypothetical protein [Patescibacteria group bacterium]
MTFLTIKQTEKLIEVLFIEQDKEGLYKTSWGNKTIEGLREVIENIINLK